LCVFEKNKCFKDIFIKTIYQHCTSLCVDVTLDSAPAARPDFEEPATGVVADENVTRVARDALDAAVGVRRLAAARVTIAVEDGQPGEVVRLGDLDDGLWRIYEPPFRPLFTASKITDNFSTKNN
jgi:hypothetical protein